MEWGGQGMAKGVARFGEYHGGRKWPGKTDDTLEVMRCLMGEDLETIGAASGVSPLAAKKRAQTLGFVMTPQARVLASKTWLRRRYRVR